VSERVYDGGGSQSTIHALNRPTTGMFLGGTCDYVVNMCTYYLYGVPLDVVYVRPA